MPQFILGAISLVGGALLLHFSGSWGRPEAAVVSQVFGLLLVGLGQTVLIFKLIQERQQRQAEQGQKDYVRKAVLAATDAIVHNTEENLRKHWSIFDDTQREHLDEVLPPRLKAPTDAKDPAHFRPLWSRMVSCLLEKNCRDRTEITLRFCSIAETDLFHAGGGLNSEVHSLLTKGMLLDSKGGEARWFCACNSPETCTRSLQMQVIILDPQSDAASDRQAAEGSDGSEGVNEVQQDIQDTIDACRKLVRDMDEKPLAVSSKSKAKVSLVVRSMDHHPPTSFIHSPDWVSVEMIHWGRKLDGENPPGPSKCLGGRVPALIFTEKAAIHEFLKDQFDLQWRTSVDGTSRLAWLGTRKVVP